MKFVVECDGEAKATRLSKLTFTITGEDEKKKVVVVVQRPKGGKVGVWPEGWWQMRGDGFSKALDLPITSKRWHLAVGQALDMLVFEYYKWPRKRNL